MPPWVPKLRCLTTDICGFKVKSSWAARGWSPAHEIFWGAWGGTPVSCGVRIFYGGPRDPINKSMPPWVPPFTVHTADICGSEVLANWAARGWPRGLVILRKHTVKHRRRQKKIKIGALARSKISSFKKNRVFRLQKNVFSSFYWSKWFFSSLNCIGIYVSISRRDRLSLASVH